MIIYHSRYAHTTYKAEDLKAVSNWTYKFEIAG